MSGNNGPAASTRFLSRFKAISMTIFFTISSIFGCTYILLPLLPLAYLRPKLHRCLVDRLIGLWLLLPPFVMKYVFGLKVHVTGDAIKYGEPALIILNHRSRLDWLYLWNVIYKMDPWLLTTEKITLKAILKYVPGAGWAMGSNAFIFLYRNWDKDARRLSDTIDYYSDSGHAYQLVLFPEGTDKCPRATARNLAYEEKTGLHHFEYVLHPRTTGFTHLVNKMRSAGYLGCIYDITIGYPDIVVQNELEFILHGACPENVHFDVRRVEESQLPATEGLSRWLTDLWKEKEERLREFYSQPVEDRRFTPSGSAHKWPVADDAAKDWSLRLVSLIWLLTTLVWGWFLFTVPYIFLYFIASVAFYISTYRLFGGVECLLLMLWKKRNGRA